MIGTVVGIYQYSHKSNISNTNKQPSKSCQACVIQMPYSPTSYIRFSSSTCVLSICNFIQVTDLLAFLFCPLQSTICIFAIHVSPCVCAVNPVNTIYLVCKSNLHIMFASCVPNSVFTIFLFILCFLFLGYIRAIFEIPG